MGELEQQRHDLVLRDQGAQARISELEEEGTRMAAWAASLRGVADRSNIEVLQLRNEVLGLQCRLSETVGKLHRGEMLRREVLDTLHTVQKRLSLSPSASSEAALSAVLVGELMEKLRARLE